MTGNANGIDANRAQCRLGFRARLCLSTCDNHASSSLPESFRDRSANPSSAAGDQGHPPLKTEEPAHVDTFAFSSQCAPGCILRRGDQVVRAPSEPISVPDRTAGGLHPARRRHQAPREVSSSWLSGPLS